MIGCNLAGIQSINYDNCYFDSGVEVDVVEDKEWSTDDEKALAIKYDGFTIGYIPSLRTIRKRFEDAKEFGDGQLASKHRDIYYTVKSVRDNVITDMYINHLAVKGRVYRIVRDEITDKVKSIGVTFDYM